MNNGFADVPEGVEAGARWNYLLSVNLGAYVFEDVDVKFGLDFDPADDFDALTLKARTPFLVRSLRRSSLWRRRRASTTAKRASSRTARTSTSVLVEYPGLCVDFAPQWVCTTYGVYVYSLDALLILRSAVETVDMLQRPLGLELQHG